VKRFNETMSAKFKDLSETELTTSRTVSKMSVVISGFPNLNDRALEKTICVFASD